MAKITLAEIVAKWERQLEQVNALVAEYEKLEQREHYEISEPQRKSYQRNLARKELLTEHVRELQQYALIHAR